MDFGQIVLHFLDKNVGGMSCLDFGFPRQEFIFFYIELRVLFTRVQSVKGGSLRELLGVKVDLIENSWLANRQNLIPLFDFLRLQNSFLFPLLQNQISDLHPLLLVLFINLLVISFNLSFFPVKNYDFFIHFILDLLQSFSILSFHSFFASL